MGDITKTLFGGSTSESGPVDATPRDVRELRGSFTDAIKSFLQGNQYGNTTNQTPQGAVSAVGSPDQYVAPITQAQTNALGATASAANDPTRQNYLDSVLRGEQLTPGANPALAGAITAAQRTTLNNLQSTLDTALPGRFTLSGQQVQPNANLHGGSSAFDRAAAIATQAGANASADIASNIANNAYNVGTQNQVQAANISQNEVQTQINNLNAQALPQLIQQQGLTQGLALYQQGIQNFLAALQAATGAGGLSNIATKSSSSEDKGIIPGLTKAFAAAYPAGI